ncbi:glycosyltransferase involved in cell wall biosynthesis [Mucilaginibacter sp. SG538B]|uniref:glycosyltransferase family 4 protein n=1 Tax=Mucilaginibacter sp. SG538B TaxID=2587021 RepID=UPI00159D0BA4|nr:glycosyltransferase family 4 protein [Mucilaginibacter sp. SG538B]NVM66525.1 glycosyltransferase involved in cell wall biosynthesis [Mucilaginibacter sp. SG538B]
MRVLLTNSFYYPAFVGGAEVSVKILAEGLVNAGHQVYVLTTGLDDQVYRVNGVIVISLKQRNIFSIYGGTDGVSNLKKSIWHLIDSCNLFYHTRITSILKRISPDIVNTNTIQGFSPVLWPTIKKLKIPLVHTMRDYYLLCHKCSMFNNGNCATLCAPCKVTHQVKKNFLSYPDHYIAISDFILRKHRQFFNIADGHATTIYNAVLKAGNTKHNTETGKFRLGYIGRVAADKGVRYLVDELLKLPDDKKDMLKIIFAGKGDPEFVAQLQIELTGIEHAFLGVISPADFYGRIDTLIVPALWNEPFGRTVIESLSFGVPVCQSDRGGLEEIFSADCSWLFSPDEGNLLDLLQYVLDNRDEVERKKQNCIRRSRDFSADNYIKNYLELYHKILVPSALLQSAN